MIGGRRVERRRGRIRVRLPASERELLARLAQELAARLGCDEDADDLRRLFPLAYPESPDDEAEYQALVRTGLLESKRDALRVFEATIERSELSETELDAWLQVLNDLRLVLGTRLDVTEETFLHGVERDDPDAPALAVYAYLSWLQEQVVEAADTFPS